MANKYDFIIIGGGTSGTLLSSKLSQTPSQPQILLLESGSDTRELPSDAPAERFLRISDPHLDQGYSTVSESGLNNRKLPYSRGRGLGGSTLINFGAWTYGAKDDYDHWAECVGDEMWRWEGVKGRFKEIEKYHVEMPEGMGVYANPSTEVHGDSGPVDVSLPFALEKEFPKLIEAAEEVGLQINPDINSGYPLGICMNVSTSYKTTGRTTSAGAYLKNIPSNLDIWTDSKVAKLLFKDKKAIGVELVDGRQVFCNKEIILSAGTIDSPKILLLSGIGPASELQSHNINKIHNLPGVGKNLQDHLGVPLMIRMTGDFSDRWAFDSSPEKKEAARKLWNETKTGPMNDYYSNIAVGFDKLPILYEAPEFKALDPSVQEYLRRETVPHFELTGGGLNYLGFDFGSDCFLSSMGIGLNLQSRGSITLSSSNPADAPLIHFDFLQHPFDRRVLTEGIRLMMRYMKAKAFEPYAKESIMMPTSESDEDILKYVEMTGSGALHAAGTVKMGQPGDVMACVDSRFRVFGIEGLRVADMSVCPELTNNHTQATAYLIGQLAAEVLTFDYSL